MNQNKLNGQKGEEIAVGHLRSKGYTIKGRNIKVGYREIDILATKGEFLIVVEVKWRSSAYFCFPEEGLSARQQRNLIEAADEYVKKINWNGPVRFDVIAIIQTKLERRILHIEEAFWPFF